MDTLIMDTLVEPKKKRVKPPPLQMCMHQEPNIIEIGVDEAGRGPLFGRVYAAAVILPKDDSFDHFKMKDSKKFTSKKTNTIEEAAEYIKNNALAWHVSYEDEKVIDKINILQATQQAMHKAINETRKKYDTEKKNDDKIHLLIDGNYFNICPRLFYCAIKISAYSSKTVDSYSDCHT